MSRPARPPADLVARLRLARTEGVGPVGYRRLLGRFGDAASVLEALPGLIRAAGRADRTIPSAAAIEDEIAAVIRLGGSVVMEHMPNYPLLLTLLPDPPPALAVLGDPALLTRKAVAVVGGRQASLNGQKLAANLAAGLAEAGLTVVSGMARGVDAAAHEATLAVRGGITIAAVAGGLDQPYPSQHGDLQRRIAETGVVVSEAPLGTQPQARHFPRRNRIIAGLALGVVVVEAARHSGSLITARLALEGGREVFAVPGSPLDPRCHGSNDLIRQGAQLTETVEDILAALPAGPDQLRPPTLLAEPSRAFSYEGGPDQPPPETRNAVLRLLGPSPTSVDDLLRHCQFTSHAAVMAALLDLELGGRIESLPGNRVALIPEFGG
jgi:DNA processing protein